jgi:hypothetical protein
MVQIAGFAPKKAAVRCRFRPARRRIKERDTDAGWALGDGTATFQGGMKVEGTKVLIHTTCEE